MTGADVERVLERFPRLTAHGIGLFEEHRVPMAERAGRLEEGREELRHCLDEMARAETWIRTVKAIKTPNPRHSSYGYKHMAEAATGGYVSNGALIAAAAHYGFEVTVVPGSANVLLNISEKSLPREA